MASKRSGSNPKRKPKKALKDLEAKNDRKIRGGGKDLPIIKYTDSASIKLF
jgi:hypothetical protein